jgi:hypothetical protein
MTVGVDRVHAQSSLGNCEKNRDVTELIRRGAPLSTGERKALPKKMRGGTREFSLRRARWNQVKKIASR